MKTIAIKELQERVDNMGIFHCRDISCSNCIFNTRSTMCKGYSHNFDFNAIKNHDFGKLRRTGIFGLLMFATNENDMQDFAK